MSDSDRVTRTNAGLAATATTLMALVAMAAGVPSLRAAPVVRLAQAEVVSGLSDSAAVRSMAAVVAAVARDLLNGPGVSAVIPPRMIRDVVVLPGRPIIAAVDTSAKQSPLEALGERRLDLPPPVC